MALIRRVLQNTAAGKWAYIEYSDEEEKVFTILGGQEFDNEEEAVDYSKGFAAGSYDYVEPKEVKINIIEKEIAKTEEHLLFLQEKLIEAQTPEPEPDAKGKTNKTKKNEV